MRTRGLRIITALTAAAALVLGGALTAPVASAEPASVTSITARTALMGTWVGSYAGFENGTYARGLEKFVITTVRGLNAKGTWQYRTQASDPWSEPAPLQFVLTPAIGWLIGRHLDQTLLPLSAGFFLAALVAALIARYTQRRYG